MGALTLPTFLGIGVPRAGTTWLHTLLSAHPDVYLPTKRKEVRFFDRHFSRGPGWYAGFFPPPDDAARYLALGEISPQYLYCDECPERIWDLLGDVKLIVLLRHPVDRAYSHYGFVVQRKGYSGSFESFLAERPRALEMGSYSRYLDAYRRRFPIERMLLLLFEEAVVGDGAARGALGRFLGVPESGFSSSTERVNPSTVPRFRSLSRLTVETGRRLRRHHLEGLVDVAGRLGLRRVLTSGRRIPRLDPDVRRELSTRFEAEFAELERTWGLDLVPWRDPRPAREASASDVEDGARGPA